MRLSSIKLSGFKSFVDPTSISLPGDLIGIVGPNGCGKSNTIDAVRWVMGETSAKQLRGDSMDDVIFTGSASRKPVGTAYVELVFDNSDASLGGEYARYAEVAVRREVSRDGQSRYFLNNTRCRRRDIRDIFLGTGLGPRSYSIIEQGMISRLIDAKPEEMRVYLEEAAGISKYKERRRETETRIRHTRDNLDRLDDLREEVDKQLAHLKRQASTAEKYRVLKDDEHKVRGELLGLRLVEFNSRLGSADESIRQKEIKLEEQVAELRQCEASIETERQNQSEASDGFNTAQGNYYKLGSEVSKIEQQIRFTRESREQQSTELEQLERSLQEARDHIEADRKRIKDIDESMASDQPTYDKLQADQKISADMLVQAKSKLAEWQTRADEHARRESGFAQTAQVELSRMDQLERGIAQTSKRSDRLQTELNAIAIDEVNNTIEQTIADETAIAAEEARLVKNLESGVADLQSLREKHKQLLDALDGKRATAQTAIGKLASLEALQQAALGDSTAASGQWLDKYQLVERPRLAETLKAEPGWENAVELVLGDYLEAVCVDDMSTLEKALSGYGQESGRLTMFEYSGQSNNTGAAGTLAAKVTADDTVLQMLSNVQVAGSLADALSSRSALGDGQSLITQDGWWVGASWIRTGITDSQGSVLQRETEIASLREQLETDEQAVATLQNDLSEINTKLGDHESRRETLQTSLNQVLHRLSDTKSLLVSSQKQLEQYHSRQSRLREELAEIEQIKGNDEQQVKEARDRRAEALEAMESLTGQSDELKAEQQELQAELARAEQLVSQERDAGQEIAIRMESMRTARETTDQNLTRMQAQIEQFTVRQEQLSLALSSDEEDPLIALEASLDGVLSAHHASESTLAAAREALEKSEQRLRSHEQARLQAESRVQSAREAIQEERMETQEVRVRVKTVREQMVEADYNEKDVLESLPEEATAEEWARTLEDLERKIQRLGPINLAAIEEHTEQLERKEYLDKQHVDVTDALTTLESAIAKIDKETRARFKETFDKVNAKVSEIFPRLFGGGKAHLELTGDDLLNTGVTVLAQPPGKKITSNQLLSGGEKALTAVALVFAFFELNPSPFCMLDEVDAPLDDANVGRFCAMVKEMSERVQFIFITHNKLTMELAQQLMGVTMNEPGVSRLVAVDIDEAAELAGA